MHINQFSATSRTFTVAGIPVTSNNALEELEIQLNYTGHFRTDKALVLDHVIQPLFKASPAMLAALEKVETLIDGPLADLLTGDQLASADAYEVLEEVRAAIAAAKPKT